MIWCDALFSGAIAVPRDDFPVMVCRCLLGRLYIPGRQSLSVSETQTVHSELLQRACA